MIRVEGVNKTVDKLWKYSKDFFEAASKITKTVARMVVKEGKSRAPIGPKGNLRKSIKAKYFLKDGPAATVMPRARNAPHRHLVAYGTAPRAQKGGKSTGVMPKNDFMDGADDSANAYFNASIRNEVAKHVVI
jgi:hypothetical protein